jgi:hypothetical protein
MSNTKHREIDTKCKYLGSYIYIYEPNQYFFSQCGILGNLFYSVASENGESRFQ